MVVALPFILCFYGNELKKCLKQKKNLSVFVRFSKTPFVLLADSINFKGNFPAKSKFMFLPPWLHHSHRNKIISQVLLAFLNIISVYPGTSSRDSGLSAVFILNYKDLNPLFCTCSIYGLCCQLLCLTFIFLCFLITVA